MLCPVCRQPLKLSVSHSEKNPNRRYYACGNREHFKASFVWADTVRVETSVSPVTSEKNKNVWGSDVSTGAVSAAPSNGDGAFTTNGKPDPVANVSSLSSNGDGAASKDGVSVASSNLSSSGVGDGSEQDSASSPLSFLRKVETVNVQPTKARTWSKYQQDIFTFVDSDSGNAVVEAVAGSGKTTTLVEALSHTPSSAEVGFLAFNKHIADELKERAPSHVHVSTLHSLGYSNAKQQLGNSLQVSDHKLFDLFDTLDPFGDERELKPTVAKLVDLLKATLREPTQEDMAYLVDRYNIEVNGDAEKVFELAAKLYAKSIADKDELDFEDMLFWSAKGDIKCHQFDVLFVDEAQDMNNAQIQMILRSIKPNGRIVCVGDRNQSIYGFRGADTDAIRNLIAATNAVTLPLSISYRCPKTAVRMAQALVPQIEYAESAIEGVFGSLNGLGNMRAGDMVLCRTNAPLVKPCMDLIRSRVKATIRGRDIGTGLVSMLKRGEKRVHTDNLTEVLGYLQTYVSQECAKLNRIHKETRALALQDQLDTLIALSDGCYTTKNVIRVIGEVFSNDKAAVMFSSCHRAKGLESERVFILHPELMPFSKATKDWEMQQEKNLQYVAWTRTKNELYFVNEK